MAEQKPKKEVIKVSLEKRLLWARWDKIVNMTASELRTFRQSDDGKSVGWDSNDAKRESVSGMAGHDAAKVIEKMIVKAGRYRGQHKNMPNWTPDEWKLANKQIAYISRARSNVGPLVDDNDEKTPKAKAMMLWGRDEIRSRGNFPDKKELKKKLINDDLYYDQVNKFLD